VLQKPDLPDEALAASLEGAHGLRVAEVVFLPLGNDRDTAVYRVVAEDGRAYFLKLRRGVFDETGVAVPRLLHQRGVAQVIPPIPTPDGRLWTRLQPFALVLYPFVAGHDAHAIPLTEDQWRSLGAALAGVHAIRLPDDLVRRVPTDAFGPRWRDALLRFQTRVEREEFDDPAALGLADLLRAERARIDRLARRHEQLAAALRARSPARVLCHGDVHFRNVLVDDADGALYLVDWDTLAFAPPERDFEFVGGRWGGEHEARLMQRGYGGYEPDQTALAYYRYNRIVEDLAVLGEELLDAGGGGANRGQHLAAATTVFHPGGPLDIADRVDRA
jgi:spectinomycin phosphotransferase